MLKLKNIVKNYTVGDMTVRALKGVSVNFRRSDFVSILGPSGCGKTTMLNIIGGLDRYTDGDLVIEGKTTKDFKDRDWDIYRNHRIGFVFQSYNLIPHQSVLSNVELALTIAGMSKQERRAKAKAALDKVGLSDQYNKRPNQLSGGQSQRVAIARALVNDPEILLADEPTGALDTVTSKQIMDLVKEIAKERLVIMVTHNSELAEQYSTRIIRLLDGELVSDSRPFSEEEEADETKAALAARKATEDARKAEELKNNVKGKGARKKERAKMSFWTAFKLSLQNLFTKKKRTVMTSIAGSIGIIGVSLVLAVSYGVQAYINDMQNDMLSGNPITIEESSLNISAMMQRDDSDIDDIVWENGKVNVSSTIANLVKRSENMSNIMQSNEITQEYIDYVLALPTDQAAAVFLEYGLDLTNNIYTDFKPAATKPVKTDGGGVDRGDADPEVMSLAAIKAVYSSVLSETEYSDYAGYINSLDNSFSQITDNDKYILEQYDLLDGKYATEEDELMLVLRRDGDGYHWLSDMLLAQLGFYSQNEFMNLVFRATQTLGNKSADYIAQMDRFQFDYDDFFAKDFVYYPNGVAFKRAEHPAVPVIGNATYVPELNAYDVSAFHHRAYEKDFTATEKDSGIPLKIVGILEPKPDLSYGSLSSGFFYTEALREKIFEIEKENESEIVKTLTERGSFSSNITKYLENSDTKIMTGVVFEYGYMFPYGENPAEKKAYATVGAASALSGMANMFSGMMSSMGGGRDMSGILEALNAKTLSLRHLTGRRVERANLDLNGFVDKAVKENPDKYASVQAVLAQGGVSDLTYEYKDNIHIISAACAKDGATNAVTITLDKKGAVTGYTCDCGEEDDGPCAHVVAVAMFYIAEAEDGAAGITLTPIIFNETIANYIAVYPVDFKTKDFVLEYLARWNQPGAFTYTNHAGEEIFVSADRSNVEPQDIIGLIIGIINTMINIITVALVAFTSLSLVVSTVMIGIITYVSVVERIKEIGVIRSLGGSKRDVSNLFTAETFIIGLVSGLIGIAVTYLLSLVINLLIGALAGIGAIAILPWNYAAIMVGISVLLTLVSGVTPSRSAAKKDPVDALRTE